MPFRLSPQQRNSIITFLTPYMGSQRERESRIRRALDGCNVLNQIEWSGPAEDFADYIVRRLEGYGSYNGELCLVILLQHLKSYYGHDVQAEFDALIKEIFPSLPPDPELSTESHQKPSEPQTKQAVAVAKTGHEALSEPEQPNSLKKTVVPPPDPQQTHQISQVKNEAASSLVDDKEKEKITSQTHEPDPHSIAKKGPSPQATDSIAPSNGGDKPDNKNELNRSNAKDIGCLGLAWKKFNEWFWQNPLLRMIEIILGLMGVLVTVLAFIAGNAANSLPPDVYFKWAVTPSSPLVVYFEDQSPDGVEVYEWNFGDGSPLAYGRYLQHTYTRPGNYLVELRGYEATYKRTLEILPFLENFLFIYKMRREDIDLLVEAPLATEEPAPSAPFSNSDLVTPGISPTQTPELTQTALAQNTLNARATETYAADITNQTATQDSRDAIATETTAAKQIDPADTATAVQQTALAHQTATQNSLNLTQTQTAAMEWAVTLTQAADNGVLYINGTLVNCTTCTPFWMDKYEVSNAMFDQFGSAAVSSEGLDPQKPRVKVSYDEALKFCENLGGTLPTADQWLLAARSDLRYPWGDTPITHDHAVYGMPDLNSMAAVDSPNLPDSAMPYQGASEEFGVWHLMGNAREWVLESKETNAAYGGDYISIPDRVTTPEFPLLAEGGNWSTGFRCVYLNNPPDPVTRP